MLGGREVQGRTHPLKPASWPPERRALLLLSLAAAFVFVGAGALAAVRPAGLRLRHLLLLVGTWSLAWGGAFLLLRWGLPEADVSFLPPVALLTGWGMLLLARLAPGFLVRQSLWLLVGTGGMVALAVWRGASRFLRRYRYTLVTFGLLLLATTLRFGVNPSGYGARLWLGCCGLYFQPSELLKVLLIVYLASYLADRRVEPRDGRLWAAVVAPILLMVGLALILVAWQEDLGAALLFYLTFLAMLYLAWGKGRYVAVGIALFVPLFAIGAKLSTRVALRIDIWLHPWAEGQADRAYQLLQSLYALADGRLLGQGVGEGMPRLIPAVHTDFVYAALVEEFGLAGAVALITLLAYLVQRGLRLAQRTPSPFESLLAGGIAALIAMQSFVIIGGDVRLLPLTGVTLPFLSYGGSSLVTMLLLVGMWLNLSAPHPRPLSLTLPLEGTDAPPLPTTARRLGTALFLLLALAAFGTGFWAIWRSDDLRARPTNPRRILAEMRIRRGRIFDRRGVVLAGIAVDEMGYVERTYPHPEAAPVLGYATLNYGTAGIEAVCDRALRGEAEEGTWAQLWRELYHRPLQGEDVTLTLDVALQAEAQARLEGRRGAIVLLDAHTGEVLALASAPTFDPARVAEQWDALSHAVDAPLLNRATQELAQPGSILETVVLDAVRHTSAELLPTVPLTAPLPVDGAMLTCLEEPSREGGWEAALQASCPAPFAEAGAAIGAEGLEAAFRRWGLTEAPSFALPTVAAAWPPDDFDASLEAVGQGALLVTPLQMARVAAALGNGGVMEPLRLIHNPPPGCEVPTGEPRSVLSSAEAAALLTAWPEVEGAVGHRGEAVAGEERRLAWFIGLNSAQVPRYAVAVLLEGGRPDDAAQIGAALLQSASR